MEELIHIDNLCNKCGFFTSDTLVNGGYGCSHKDCDDGAYVYNGDVIDWHEACRIVAIKLTKRNIRCNRRLAKKFMKKRDWFWIRVITLLVSSFKEHVMLLLVRLDI